MNATLQMNDLVNGLNQQKLDDAIFQLRHA